jgi:hypothetical protein
VGNSDYKNKRLNINNMLPSFMSRLEIVESIQENLFNRYLTKDEFTRINGVIGDRDPVADRDTRIRETDAYRQEHQLQPVAHSRVGSVDYYMSFPDMLRRLEYLGVNTERFNEWGKSVQFNWAPPIDLDKIINYQNYFWVSDDFDDIPQYVTIQNRCTWVSARADQTKRTIISNQDSVPVLSAASVNLSVAGNVADNYSIGEHLVVYNQLQESVLVRIESVTFNGSTLNTDFIFNKDVPSDASNFCKTQIEFTLVSGDPYVISVEGNYSDVFSEGYVFSLDGSPTEPLSYNSVESSTYDEDSNRTLISIKEDLNATDYNICSMAPLPLLNAEELNAQCIENYTTSPYGEWNSGLIGELIWSPDKLLVQSELGRTSINSDDFTDSNVNFSVLGVRTGDILRIIDGKGAGEYPILSVSPNTVGVDPTAFFFTRTNIKYQIVRRQLTSAKTNQYASRFLTNKPESPNLYDVWIDEENDTLNQFFNFQWNIVANNISSIISFTNGRHLVDTNELTRESSQWSNENKWVHKTQLSNLQISQKAEFPIIEFSPFISFSDTSFAEKEWKYRPDANNDFSVVDVQPTYFELLDTRVVDGGEVSFVTSQQIILDEKFGNLTDDISPGDRIVLGDFGVNTSNKEVESVEFYQVFPEKRYQTVINITTPINDPFDIPLGAYIAPERTSLGDLWSGFDDDGLSINWLFEGIKNISASSVQVYENSNGNPEPFINPMLKELIESKTVSGGYPSVISNPDYETNIGLVWQEFAFVDPIYEFGLAFDFDESLHDLTLYEDYQEGDLRVYINDIRQYGNYADVRSSINPDFVGGIIFDSDVLLTENDVVRFELGEYAENEIGRRAIPVNTEAGLEPYNLVDIRKLEQIKQERNQRPYFRIYDVSGEPKIFANTIFRYNESSDFPVNPFLLSRAVINESTRDFEFINELYDDSTGELYCYYDSSFIGNELQNLWKVGLNNDQYVPQKIEGSDLWELPNQLYYNVEHKNRRVIGFRDLFRHFRTIAENQKSPGIQSNVTNLFHLDDEINYGIGGSIREYNDNFDLLVSTMFVNNVSPLELYRFAHDQYENNFTWLEERFFEEFLSLINDPSQPTFPSLFPTIAEELIDMFETNSSLSRWFGDSTTYNEENDTGIKNWIATLPYLGLVEPRKPYLNIDDTLGIKELIHHDGHRAQISLLPSLRERLNKQLLTLPNAQEQIVISDSDSFPVSINGRPLIQGDFLVRTVTSNKTRKVYRYNFNALWEEISYEDVLASVFLEVENRLYNNIPEFEELRYDFSKNESDVEYSDTLERQFLKYTNSNGIFNVFANEIFYDPTDPFTWNYSNSPITNDPVTGSELTDLAGSWQGLYEKVYGTPYPHLEPWKLQGYIDKPEWWDTIYLNTSGQRRWNSLMWLRILDGIIPTGELLPDGETLSVGAKDEVTSYDYVSVNISDTDTLDGIPPDGLLPPFWSGSNSDDPRIRSLYEAVANDFVELPQLDFKWEDNGREEWKWRTSSQKLYDDMATAFILDPLKFTSQSYGIDFISINCLKVDSRTKSPYRVKDSLFHGDFVSEDGDIHIIDGTGQWYTHYNRYFNFDGEASEFRRLWANWSPQLSYEMSAFVDTKSFLIANDTFDITTRDYALDSKYTPGIDRKLSFGLTADIMAVPSRFARNREQGIGWTAEFANYSPTNEDLKFYPTENYSYRVKADNSTLRLNSFELKTAEIREERGIHVVNYNQSLRLTTESDYPDLNDSFFADIIFDGTTTLELSIIGSEVRTVQDLLDSLNDQMESLGTADLRDGNIAIFSDTIGSGSTVQITDRGLFASLYFSYAGLQPPTIEPPAFEQVFVVNGNKESYFKAGSVFDIIDSTNFTGTYTVLDSRFDPTRNETNITVNETLEITDYTVDGFVEPRDALNLPDTWLTGTEVFLNGNATPPSPLDNTAPYYVIRLNDRELQLADTENKAYKGSQITNITGSGFNYMVGRLQRTFRALSGQVTDSVWRRHYSDTREVKTCPNRYSISNIQNMVDFITGYEDYLYDQGFRHKNPNGDNFDEATGRTNDWQFEMEKFINNLYLLTNIRQEDPLEYPVEINSTDNTLTIKSGPVGWETGATIVFVEDEGVVAPEPFNVTYSNLIPYYIIRTPTQDVIQLAYSKNDALKGKAIDIRDDGVGENRIKVYKRLVNTPVLEINPMKDAFWINHETGVLANILEGSKLDTITNQGIFDNSKELMNNSELVVFRLDKETKISTTGQLRSRTVDPSIGIDRYIGGADLFFDGYENIIRFEDYSSDGTLIYDSFLGINTPNFFLEFNRQNEITFRPNVGGFVFSNDALSKNIESSVEDLRYMYDTNVTLESNDLTKSVRQSLGYDGTVDYMDNIGLNAKTQFLFWKGMIQNKGTNFAVDAFVNQSLYGSANIDEFWAYRLADFGSMGEKIYPEVLLLPNDTKKSELRLEFVLPDEAKWNSSFTEISLVDQERWWNQPDQLEKLSPDPAFWFDVDVLKRLENVANQIDVTSKILDLGEYVNSVIITRYDPIEGKVIQLKRKVDFDFVSRRAIKFLSDNPEDNPEDFIELNISIITYFYDANNPAKIIDKSGRSVTSNVDKTDETAAVITEVPIWNPAFDEYFYLADSIVTFKDAKDQANYTNYPDGGSSDLTPWLSDKVDTVWFDKSKESYVPYYDDSAITNFDERIRQWGKLQDWADIAVYQWVQSDAPPSEWDGEGQPYTLLYRNDALNPRSDDPVWVLEEDVDIFEEYIAGLVGSSNTTSLTGELEIYLNGKFSTALTVNAPADFTAYASTLPESTYINIVKRGITPTPDQLDNGLYKYDTPYSSENRVDPVSGNPSPLYYFWVRGITDAIEGGNFKLSIFEAERAYKSMTHPYMIIDGLRDSEFGYGIVYGTTFDPFDYDVPNRYTQVIVKGLDGVVKGDSRYTLRFTRDFTLRDKLDDNLSNKNRHVEWKLFRERQLSKIDIELWEKLISAMVNNPVKDRVIDRSTNVPTLNRILYDELYGKDTRYGLGTEQVFTESSLAKETLNLIINDPAREFKGIEIDSFRQTYSLDTKTDVYNTMYEIYDTFSNEDVNYIFFQMLRDAFSLKKEYEEIFKTSWVALQIAQNVSLPRNINQVLRELEPGGECGDGEVITEIPESTQVPLPSASPTPTPTPSISASPTPSASAIPPTPTATQTPTPTQTGTVTPTPSITPTVTPTISNSPTPPVTPTPEATVTGTLTPTPTPSITGTVTPTPTPTQSFGASPTQTQTVTPTPTGTATPTPTQTPTASTAESLPPGGFIENPAGATARGALDTATIDSFMPVTDVGTFTFPAPWNTEGIRLTNSASNYATDSVFPVDYSYWRVSNNHVGSDVMKIMVRLAEADGGPSIIEYNKVTKTVSAPTPIFDTGVLYRNPTAFPNAYFSAVDPNKMYWAYEGSLKSIDVSSLPLQSGDVTEVFDADRIQSGYKVWQSHTDNNDRFHVMTYRTGAYSNLGAVVYDSQLDTFDLYPSSGAYDESQITKDGNYIVIKENVDGLQGEDNRIIRVSDGAEIVFNDLDGAAGHSDLGYDDYMVHANNYAPDPAVLEVTDIKTPLTSSVQIYSGSTGAAYTNSPLPHISWAHAKPVSQVPLADQYVVGGGISPDTDVHENEILAVPLDGSEDCLIVAPSMGANSGGGGNFYNRLPKGNTDITGEYFIWSCNRGGSSRLDIFMVRIPSQLL